MVCAKCKEDFSSANEVARCCECHLEYHAACCRLRTLKKLHRMLEKNASTWRCDVCFTDTASLHSRSDNDDPSILDVLKNIKEEMSQSRKESVKSFAALEASMTSVKESLEEMKGKLSAVETENAALKEECSLIKAENKRLAQKLFTTQCEVHELQQYSRNHNLEVRGVPVTTGEDVYGVLESLAKAIAVPYSRRDISVAHRVPGRTANIVVQFVSRTTRAEWLAAAKVKKAKTTDLRPSLAPGKVFVNEHLTPHNKTVLGRARSLVKEGRLAFAWTKEGKILVRKKIGDRAVQVWFLDDVDKAAFPSRESENQPLEQAETLVPT